MRRANLAFSLLAAALLISNAWWAYRSVDTAVTQSYRDAQLEESRQALFQALAIINAAGAGDATKDRIVDAALTAWPAVEPFEKDGYLWVGRLGLRFNEEGRLVQAVAGA
jgi:hypothetical protein